MHIVTLTFDDGFLKSNLRIAELYEKYGLSACFNIVAGGHLPEVVQPDDYQKGVVKGDFTLWNELQSRGHEIKPHGYRHANLAQLPFDEATGLIEKCLDIFNRELDGFDAKRSIFNYPYNSHTPELEAYCLERFRAIRMGCAGWNDLAGSINPLPTAETRRFGTFGKGPDNCEAYLEKALKALFAKDEGWLVFNLHGLEDEGWGPIRGDYLDDLLARLTKMDKVKVLPMIAALDWAGGD